MRNPNGFGSIIKLGGNRRKPYAVRVTVGWDKDGKQQKRFSASTNAGNHLYHSIIFSLNQLL